LVLCLILLSANVDASPSESSGLSELERVTDEAQPTEFSDAAIQDALAKIEADPWAIVDSPEVIDILFKARLTLVWSLLAQERDAEAQVAMDDAIRSSMGRAMPAGMFGPAVLELYDRRRRALREAGTAAIYVECDTCDVMINEHRSPNPSERLYLGSYRVGVRADDGSEDHTVEIELDEVGAEFEIKVPWAENADNCAEENSSAGPDPVVVDSYRPAGGPLGLTGAFTIVGGAATGLGGGLLLSLPHYIEEGTGLTPQQAGLGLTAVAGVFVVFGVVALVVDKTVIARKRERAGERARLIPLEGRVEF